MKKKIGYVKQRLRDKSSQKKTDFQEKQEHNGTTPYDLMWKVRARGSDRNDIVGEHEKMKTFIECFELTA